MSIFSRLKKPGPAEPKSAGEPAAAGERDSHPAPAANGEQRHAAAPAPKTNGVHAPAGKLASPAAPAPKTNGLSHGANGVTNGVANGKAASSAPASNGAAKRPELSKTMLYGAAVPAPAPARAPAAAPAPISVPDTVHESAKGSLDLAIEMALGAQPVAMIADGTSTDSDQAALIATFEDLAVPYVTEVRGVMMELEWGEAQASWLEMVRPVLRSLRKMAEPVGNAPLAAALDGFDAALAAALAPGQPSVPSGATRDALRAAYAPLRACLPRAFELDGERDRREPLIVRALLEQVPGLDPLAIQKLVAAGFGRLSALYAGRADEIAAVTGIPGGVAAAIVARVEAFRRATPAGLAVVDTGETLRALTRLLATLRAQHAAFEDVSRSWSDQDRTGKRQLRRERQLSLLQITIELVRLGEVDLVQRLEKLPFGKKIDEIDELISRVSRSAKTKTRGEAQATAAAAAP